MKKKLPTLAQLRKRADGLWSTLILVLGTPLDKLYATCAVCNENPAISAHHVFHKSMHGRFRYHPLNGIPICRKCHFMERRDPAPVVFAAIRYHGYGKYAGFAVEVLAGMGKGGYQRKRADFNGVISTLEILLANEVIPSPEMMIPVGVDNVRG